MASGGMSRLIPDANNNKEERGGGEKEGGTGSFVLTEQGFCHLTKEADPLYKTVWLRKQKNKSILKVRRSLHQVQ